jgi:hypothetical protein
VTECGGHQSPRFVSSRSVQLPERMNGMAAGQIEQNYFIFVWFKSESRMERFYPLFGSKV